MIIRGLTPADLPHVVRLRQRTFRRSAHPNDELANQYSRRIFLESPWSDPSVPSLVCENDAGEIVGFLGRLTRRFELDGSSIKAVTPTQLCVDEDASAIVALRLLKEMLAGPQDLTWADTATERVLQIWRRIGGEVPAIQSLHWLFAIRPSDSALAGLRGGLWTKGTRFASRWLLRDADRTIARRIREEVQQLQVQSSPSADSWNKAFHVLAGDALRVANDPSELEWMLRELGSTYGPDAVRYAIVRDRRAEILGVYLFVAKKNGVGEVVALTARRGGHVPLMWALAADALELGIRALRGRLEPGLVFEAEDLPVRIVREAPWTLFATPRREISAAIHSGRTALTRLDGEWWLNF